MATVYLGLAERGGGFQRHVAVKMMHGTGDGDGQLSAALLREAKLVAKIRHPNVVPVMDIGEDPHGLFVVMEYVEGDNLAALRRMAKRAGEQIPLPVAVRIITDALAGLHAAHELTDESGANLEVVHRDFSPHNILVGTDGVSRLTDFGIAKVAYTAGHTRTGKIKGKIAYMSPEQARAQKVDRRCDVWAAGVVAWELFSGERLYDTEDEIAALLKVVNEDPPRLASVRPDLPAELDEAVASALERNLDARCPSADALRRRILDVLPAADISEVAEFVRRVVGPKLAERQRKIEEIRQLRGKLGELSAVAGEHGSSPRASSAALTPGGMSPSFPDIRLSEQSSETALATSGPVERLLDERRRRAALIGVATGLGIGLVGVVVIAIVVAIREEPSQPATATSVAVAPPPATTAPAAATLSATPLSDLPVEPEVKLKANADVAHVKIGKDTQRFDPPRKELVVTGRYPPGTPVEAIASDGRKAKSKIPKDGGEVVLVFPKFPHLVRPIPTKTGGNIPFADNPYKKK